MRSRGGPGSPLQSLEESEHNEQRNKPQYRQGNPNDDLPRPILLVRGTAAHLRLDFSIPFPDDAFRVGLHSSFPFLASSAAISLCGSSLRRRQVTLECIVNLVPSDDSSYGPLGGDGMTGSRHWLNISSFFQLN